MQTIQIGDIVSSDVYGRGIVSSMRGDGALVRFDSGAVVDMFIRLLRLAVA